MIGPRVLIGLVLVGLTATGIRAQGDPDPKEVQAVVNKAIAYLKSVQTPTGGFAPKVAGPGVAAILAAGLLRHGVSPDDPVLAKTLKFIESYVKEDGGIYDQSLANYTTSVAIFAFKEANREGKYDSLIKKATSFLRKIQFDEPESQSSDVKHGGFGYDGKSRPDVSNTAFSVEALLAAGIPKDDPAIKKALQFISRSQNLPGEYNDQKFAKKAQKEDIGGITYTPIMTSENKYQTAAGGLRSLGGMTYGGLKSFLYAGVSKDDPRVKAAIAWCRAHYTLDENPGMGKAGLYYYYHTFAKAMEAYGENPFIDAQGKKHNWRAELFQALKSRQRPDGSWAGTREFGEAVPELATGFAILALSYVNKR